MKMSTLERLYVNGDWRWEVGLPLPRNLLLLVRLRIKVLDWHIGFGLEPGMLSSECGFLDVSPLPMVSVLFALYRDMRWDDPRQVLSGGPSVTDLIREDRGLYTDADAEDE